MSKAIAVYSLAIIIIIGASLFITLAIFLHWIDIQNIETNVATCNAKLTNYCLAWLRNDFKEEPYDWNEQAPKNCENDPINIYRPSSDECRDMLPDLY